MQSEKITLYFKQGSSDKVYHASLEAAGNNTFVVNFAYGRRGATLNTGTKTQTPVEYAAAKKIYDKLVKSKTSEGYSPGEQGSPYAHTDAESRDTGVQCQLLNFVEESQVSQYMQDAEWWAQEKFDGKRMLLYKANAKDFGIDKGADPSALIWVNESSKVNISNNEVGNGGPYLKKTVGATATGSGTGFDTGVKINQPSATQKNP